MKKIGLIISLLLLILGNINAYTSKDVMIKYQYIDNTSKHTKEIVDNKVGYELNEDKIKITLSDSKNISVIFFEVSNESLEWLKTKAEIGKDANVYYLKVLNSIEEKTIPSIIINEYSDEEKIIKIYDVDGNKIDNAQGDCYIVIEKADNTEIEYNEDTNVYKENIEIKKGEKTNREPLIIFIIYLIINLIFLFIFVKLRKDKENE